MRRPIVLISNSNVLS